MKSSFFKGTTYLTISTAIFMVSGYFLNIWLGRYLGPVNYGVYGVLISLMSFINITQTSGLTLTASKFIAENEEQSDAILLTALRLQVLYSVIITVSFFLLAQPISFLLHDATLVSYLQLTALIFPLYGVYGLYVDYYNGLHFFKKQAVLNSIFSFSKLICVVSLTYFFQLRGALVGFILAAVFPLLYGFYLPKKVSTLYSSWTLVVFSLPLICFAFLSALAQSIDLYFVKSLSLSKELPGYYTANQNISRIIFFGLSAFSVVVFPSISRSMKHDKPSQTKDLIANTLRYVLLLLVPITLLISATSKQLLMLLYAGTYTQGASSLSILSVGMGFLTFFSVLAHILNGAGSTKSSVGIAAISVVVIAIFCWFLIPSEGIVGAAISTTIGGILSVLMASIAVYRKFAKFIRLRSILKIVVASLSVYFLTFLISVPVFILPFLYGVLFTVYFFLLFLLKEITPDDWKRIQLLIPNRVFS